MTRFLQQKKSVLDLNFTLAILFFCKCKTILIRPFKHSTHYLFSQHFLFEQHLFTADPCLFSDLSIFVMKPTLQLFFVCHIKNLKEPIDQRICAGLLVLGKAQKYAPVLKNYCIIIKLANWHIRADVDFF